MNNNSICCIICKNTDKYMLVRFKKLGKKEDNKQKKIKQKKIETKSNFFKYSFNRI